jgi:hypothetical protein
MLRTNLARSLQGVFIVWIAVITFRYATAIFQSLRTPISEGKDIEWLIAWLIAVVVMAASAAGFRYALVVIPILLLSACVLIMFLSGTLLTGIVTLWFFLVAYGCGKWILRLANVRSNDSGDSWDSGDSGDFRESTAVAIPIGLIVIGLGGFVLGATHMLKPAIVWVFLIALTVPLLPRTAITFNVSLRKLPSIPVEICFPLLIIAPVLLLNFLWAVAPEIQYDANNYHLAVPRIYLASSGFVNLPYFFHSYFFRLTEMLFSLGFALQGPAAAKYMSFVFGLAATCCVFVLGKLAFDTRTGVWAAALFYTTPIVSWLSSTADNDNAVAMFLTAAVIALLKFREDRERAGWLYIAALLAGATIATKINGAFGLIPLFIAVFWEHRKSKIAVICAVLLLIVALPWYAVTYYWTGNPVFPLLNGLFRSPLSSFENRVMNANDFGIGTGLGALARLPFRLIFDTSRFGEAAPRGTAGIALLLAFPFSAVLLRNRRKATGFLIATSVSYLLLWAYSFQYLRYYTQILPVICVMAAATMFYFGARVGLAIVLILQFATTPPQFWNIPERFPIAVALGRETREHFLQRSLGPYAAVQYLNKVTKLGERVLGVDTEYVRFYLNAPLDSLVESTLNGALVKTTSMPANSDLADRLRQAGYTYILTSNSALASPAKWYPYLKRDFLNRFAKIEFRDANVSVYRLKS